MEDLLKQKFFYDIAFSIYGGTLFNIQSNIPQFILSKHFILIRFFFN